MRGLAAVQAGGAAGATKGCSGNSPVVDELINVKQGVPTIVAPAVETQKGFQYFLSNVDQTLAGVPLHVIYSFKAEGKGNEEAAEVMREALARVLVHYHPLAGRLAISSEEGRLVVDCTGEGVVFVEADADCRLEHIGDVSKPDPVALGKLFYSVPGAENVLGIPLLVAQVLLISFPSGDYATIGSQILSPIHNAFLTT
uniref:Omega-hydroxypalmitate O-feruloyl transferase n=1 Tax=Anthurium amnicola TaxID=1678845 RepID=A0A1D1ZKK6_9ARAE